MRPYIILFMPASVEICMWVFISLTMFTGSALLLYSYHHLNKRTTITATRTKTTALFIQFLVSGSRSRGIWRDSKTTVTILVKPEGHTTGENLMLKNFGENSYIGYKFILSRSLYTLGFYLLCDPGRASGGIIYCQAPVCRANGYC